MLAAPGNTLQSLANVRVEAEPRPGGRGREPKLLAYCRICVVRVPYLELPGPLWALGVLSALVIRGGTWGVGLHQQRCAAVSGWRQLVPFRNIWPSWLKDRVVPCQSCKRPAS